METEANMEIIEVSLYYQLPLKYLQECPLKLLTISEEILPDFQCGFHATRVQLT